MTRFLRQYPLVKVIILNVLAVLAYDTLRQPPARATPVTAAQSKAGGPVASADTSGGDAESQLLPLPAR